MRKKIWRVVMIGCFLLVFFNANSQIGIGTITPDSSSVLDILSNESGILIPRLSTLERDAISAPANGLIIYNVDKVCLEINVGTKQVVDWQCVGMSNSGITYVNCANSKFQGTYINGVVLNASNTFQVEIVNHAFNDVTINFSNGDLTLSGINGISVASVSPASAVISSGNSQLVEYTLTGTPDTSGYLTGFWEIGGLTCIKTINVLTGDAVFTLPQTALVVSILDGTVDIQGIIDNVTNQITIDIPYTSGIGSYEAYSGIYTTNNSGTGEGGDVNRFRLTYPSGTFSTSGNITATIEVDGNGSFDAERQLFGVLKTIVALDFQVNGYSKGNIDIDVIGGIPDRRFSDSDHKFIYLPVLANDGNTWLNNNLGANYSNINHSNFNPSQQAIAYNDHHAYGSLFQWGRYSDGHELINYTNSTTGTGVHGTTSTNAISDIPGNTMFITESLSPFDWRIPQNDNLWQGESGINNPCPQGYRLPTETELITLFSVEGITNYTTAASSSLVLPTSGYRSGSDGIVYNSGVEGYFLTSSTNGIHGRNYYLFSGGTNTLNHNRASGFSIRCIKD